MNPGRHFRWPLALLLALGLWLLMQPAPVYAGEIVVTDTLDSGAGTLRQAIADAAPGDTIVFIPTCPVRPSPCPADLPSPST